MKKKQRKTIGNCYQCKKKLTKYRLEGNINGKALKFCSAKCHDDYIDGVEQWTA